MVVISLISSLFLIQINKDVTYSQDETLNTLTWSIINTPSNVNNVIVSSSEVNFIAVGSDDRTIYAVDVANSRLYKSVDNGSTFDRELSANLINAGALMPVWDIAIAPDNVDIIVAVTSNAMPEPRQVFISTDGGANWDNTNLVIADNIGDVSISPVYGTNSRDIAAGIRTGLGTGTVYVMKTPGISSWVNQIAGVDIIALEFSPNYSNDSGLIIVCSDAVNTYLNTGIRDTAVNSTDWNAIFISPGVEIENSGGGASPGAAQIIVADISLPSDFTATDINFRQYYVSYYDNNIPSDSGIYRRNDNEGQFHYLLSSAATRGISSIAYYGTTGGGNLLAGEVKTNAVTLISDIWMTSNPQVNPPTWETAEKPPTGGANPVNPADPPANHRFYANAQLAWSPAGDRAYCGTSSADIDLAPTGAGWPNGYLFTTPLDESAFSVSPYSYDYQLRTELVDKDPESDPGELWNQTGLIDTRISQLTDIAALEVGELSTNDYNILYLSSSNYLVALDPPNHLNSIWRSTTRRLGDKWERIACPIAVNPILPDPDNDIILRVYSGSSYEIHNTRSDVLTYVARETPNIFYSPDEGQSWEALLSANLNIKDISLGSEISIYAADNNALRRCTEGDLGWLWGPAYFSGFQSCHTIYALPEDMQESSDDEGYTRWVFIGDELLGQVAYIDFAEDNPRFEITREAPIAGDTHVIVHDKFLQNKAIFIGVNDFTGLRGKMFRWIAGNSSEWTLLEPPNNAFYGIAMDRDVSYGAWRIPTPPNTTVGVDRTLTSLKETPPALEWDDLTVNITPGVVFTREPSALKLSGNDNNTLWAIDNQPYDWANQIGCLWYFIDTLAKKGPKPISPPADGIINMDPVTGRASEVNFAWYQLKDAFAYELQLSKDENFSQQLIVDPAIIPYDQTAPSWILAPGFLEINHKYYWRLRASGSAGGEVIRSPYSATMYFTVGTGLAVNTPYLGPQLFSPENACGCACGAPISFTWSPLREIIKYRLELSENADLSNALVAEEVKTTSYEYAGKLKCNTNYFWRVRALEPFPSDWSATFSFMTQPEPVSHIPDTQDSKSPLNIPVFAIVIIIAIGIVLFISILIFIKSRPSFVRPSGDPIKDIRSSLDIKENPLSKIAAIIRDKTSRLRSTKTITTESVTVNHEIKGRGTGINLSVISATLRNLPSRTRNALIMAIRRRRYLSPPKNNKDKFF